MHQEFLLKTHHLGICALLGAGFFAVCLHSAPAEAQATVAAPVSNSTTVKNIPVGAVTDPRASVPPVVYQSVFADTPTGVEVKNVDWYKANAEVGQFKRGHVDILKFDEAQTMTPLQPKRTDAAPATPATPATPAQPAASQTPGMHKH